MASFLPPANLNVLIEKCLDDISEDKVKVSFFDLTNKIEGDSDHDWNKLSFIEENDPVALIAKRYIRSTEEPITKTRLLTEIQKDQIKYTVFLENYQLINQPKITKFSFNHL